MKVLKSSWVLLAALNLLFNTARAADCDCGYLDPTTQSLWTDASITYWNESDSSQDIVFNPTESPSPYGQSSAGDSGTDLKSWTSIEKLNDYEDSFQATFRSGVQHNNTFITSQGLSLAVQPADVRRRISYGSEIVSRRRDILYGSFRASLQAPGANEGGTLLQWQIAFNSSDYISTSIYSADEAVNSSYQWSYSARRHSSQPFVNPLSALQDEYGFNEQRMDWISPDALRFSTEGTTNITAQLLELTRKSDGNFPTLGGPVSFRHSSNGENSQSQGPPIHHQPTAQIKYTRFFFNSSLPSRHSEFEQRCAAAQSPVCNTEDYTLRGSTTFNQDATYKIEPPQVHHKIPLYAIIAEAASGGIFLILLINALIERQLKAKRKEREFYAKQQQASSGRSDKGQDGYAANHQALNEDDKESISSEGTKADFEQALKVWEDPSKHIGAESDSDFDSSGEDSDDQEDPDPLRINRKSDLLSFGHGSFGHQEGLLTPRYVTPTLYRRSSNAASLSASGSQTPAGLNSSGYFEHDLQGLDERLLGLQATENLEDGEVDPRPNHSRKGSSVAGHLFAAPGLESILDEEATSSTGHINLPASSHGHSSFSGHATPGRSLPGPGFSYSARGRLSRVASTVGSITDGLPVPDSEDGHWGGGLMHGVGSASNRDKLPSSQSQARLLSSSSRSNSFFETEGGIRQVTWNPRIVEWQPCDSDRIEVTGGQLAERADGKATIAQRPQTPAIQVATGFAGWFGRLAKRLLVGEGAAGQTASGAARVEYLDGLRGFACFLVSFHHFMLIFYYNVTTASGPAHYPEMERWLRNLLGAILVNGGFNIGVFFILAARVIANRYLVRGRLQDLAEATNRRVPRLMVPISAGMILSYFMIEADGFHWLPRLASRSWSTWSYYQNYQNFGAFLDSWMQLWFTTPPNVPSVITTYATGILWTVPVIVSSSWTVFTCALIAYEIPNAQKRYSFYAACFLLSWYADRFDYFFISGLVIADLDNKLKYRKLAAEGVPLLPSVLLQHFPEKVQKIRVHGQVFAWIIMLTGAVISWLDQVDGTGSNIPLLEHGIHPDWATSKPKAWMDTNTLVYTDPRLFDFFFVIGFFLLCDLCSSFRTFFQLRFWSAFGRNAFSLYLLHGVVFWSWGSWLTIKLLILNVPYWATILVTFITCYFWLAILCEAFTRTFDKWGVGLSKALWRETSGGIGRRV